MGQSRKSTRRFTHIHRQRLDRALEHYLRACYERATAARVSEFATNYLGVTVPYFSRIVPEIVGMPPRDYMRQKQLTYAEKLLRAAPFTIEEIALRAGFGTVKTFYRCFKRKHSMTPKAFREVMK